MFEQSNDAPRSILEPLLDLDTDAILFENLFENPSMFDALDDSNARPRWEDQLLSPISHSNAQPIKQENSHSFSQSINPSPIQPVMHHTVQYQAFGQPMLQQPAMKVEMYEAHQPNQAGYYSTPVVHRTIQPPINQQNSQPNYQDFRDFSSSPFVLPPPIISHISPSASSPVSALQHNQPYSQGYNQSNNRPNNHQNSQQSNRQAQVHANCVALAGCIKSSLIHHCTLPNHQAFSPTHHSLNVAELIRECYRALGLQSELQLVDMSVSQTFVSADVQSIARMIVKVAKSATFLSINRTNQPLSTAVNAPTRPANVYPQSMQQPAFDPHRHRSVSPSLHQQASHQSMHQQADSPQSIDQSINQFRSHSYRSRSKSRRRFKSQSVDRYQPLDPSNNQPISDEMMHSLTADLESELDSLSFDESTHPPLINHTSSQSSDQSVNQAANNQSRSRSLSLNRSTASRSRSTSVGKRKRITQSLNQFEPPMLNSQSNSQPNNQPINYSMYRSPSPSHRSPSRQSQPFDQQSSIQSINESDGSDYSDASESDYDSDDSVNQPIDQSINQINEEFKQSVYHSYPLSTSSPLTASQSANSYQSMTQSPNQQSKRKPGRPTKNTPGYRPRVRTKYPSPTASQSEFRETLRQALVTVGVTQSDFARIANVSKASLCTFLQGPTSQSMNDKITQAAIKWMAENQIKHQPSQNNQTNSQANSPMSHQMHGQMHHHTLVNPPNYPMDPNNHTGWMEQPNHQPHVNHQANHQVIDLLDDQ